MTPFPAGSLRHAGCLLILATVLLSAGGCDYARMTDDEAVNTYGRKMPRGPAHTIPVDGGIEDLWSAAPATLVNPGAATPATVASGSIAYGYYCSHCHGPKADGNGTVGQSFSPLPADLRGPAVQQQNDGQLFVKISLGYKRHPPLALTVADKDRWAIISYLRTLAAVPPLKP
jgi:mono/diheme cytochrome c family protein